MKTPKENVTKQIPEMNLNTTREQSTFLENKDVPKLGNTLIMTSTNFQKSFNNTPFLSKIKLVVRLHYMKIFWTGVTVTARKQQQNILC